MPEKYIYGKAFFRYWKPEDIGFLEHGTYNMTADEKVVDSPLNIEDDR